MSDREQRTDRLVMPQGGVLPTHILDPSIVRIRADAGAHRRTASSSGSLAVAAKRFWGSYDRRYFGRVNSVCDGGEIPRDHGDFLDENLDTFQLEMIDEEALEALEFFEVLLKEPGERSISFEEYGILKGVAPQYFLRNVPRMEKETNLPYVPFEIHLYRDPDEYTVEPYTGIEFDPASAEMLDSWSTQTIGDQRIAIRQLVELLDWADYEEGWTEGREEWVTKRLELFRTKRHKGRFATKEDEKKEQEQEQAEADPYANLSPEIRKSLGLE
jgi:hypothetical protein